MKTQHAKETEGTEVEPNLIPREDEELEETEDKEKARKLSGSLLKEKYDKSKPGAGFTTVAGVEAGKDLQDPRLKDTVPDGFQVTLISFVDGKYNQLFSEIRTGSTIRNKMREAVQGSTFMKGLPGWLKKSKLLRSAFRAPKTSQQIKEKAKRLIKQQSETEVKGLDPDKEDDEKKLQWVQRSVNHVDTVGHAWVRLRATVGGKTKELSSFGMHAEDDDNYSDPKMTVPGKVEYPDEFAEGLSGGRIIARSYKVSMKKYLQAFSFAAKTHNSPPPYSMIGYHCTTFARDVAQAAGVPFKVKKYAPRGVSKLVTWGLGLAKKLKLSKDAPPDTISPSGLFESLEKDKESYDYREKEKQDDSERERIEKELEEEALEKARQDSVFLYSDKGAAKPEYVIPKEEFAFLSRDFMDMSEGDWINLGYLGPQASDKTLCYFTPYKDLVRLLGPEAARKLRPDYDPSKEKKVEPKVEPKTKEKTTSGEGSPSSTSQHGPPRRRAPIAQLPLHEFPAGKALITINPKEKGNLSKSPMGMSMEGWVSITYTGPQSNGNDVELFVRKDDLESFLGTERAAELLP